jgi:Protein of unknown function (DUF1552)
VTRRAPFFRVNRRMFLRGTGGLVLALPVLPSLLEPKQAHAEAVAAPKCFVHFRTGHGGISTANMWPAQATPTATLDYMHEVRQSPLTATTSGGLNSVSPVLSASSGVLTQALLAKMNILRGLDIPVAMAHNFGAALGYYDVDHQRPKHPTATVDQVLAYSPAFYRDVSSVKQRSVVIASPQSSSGSFGYVTRGVRASGVADDSISGSESAQQLFDRLLAGSAPRPAENPRKPVIDRVLESYKRLRNGERRLSREDLARLDQHIDAVAELQRGLNSSLPADCVVPSRPQQDNLSLRPMDGSPEKNVAFFTQLNQLLAVALNCGATRVATFHFDENNQGLTFTSRAAQGEDWHNNVAHAAASDAAAQELIRESNQVFFSRVYLDLVSRLDALGDGMGGTLLDHSLVAWGQESGQLTHWAFSMPVVTAGSAGGALKTGNYCDYRDLRYRWGGDSGSGNEAKLLWPGLIYNQWLSTIMRAMDVPASEWAEETHPGFGARVSFPADFFDYSPGAPPTKDVYSDALWQKTGEMLPFLGA